MPAERPMRADARKNYDSLVRVARRHLVDQGITTSLEAIAREAGVGVGTLYRHFPDRDHLVVAALNAQGTELRGAAATIRDSAPETERLEAWLAEVEKYLSTYQGLPDSLAQALSYGQDTPLAITCQEIIGTTEDFLAEAQQLNLVRSDVTGQDLFEATLMIAWLGTQVPERPHGLDPVRAMLRTGYRA